MTVITFEDEATTSQRNHNLEEEVIDDLISPCNSEWSGTFNSPVSRVTKFVTLDQRTNRSFSLSPTKERNVLSNCNHSSYSQNDQRNSLLSSPDLKPIVLPNLSPIVNNDIYPSLTVRMNTSAFQAVRAKSLDASSISPLSTSSSVPSSPMRRQISLSLSIPPKSPLPNLLAKKSKQAQDLFKIQNEKLQTKIKSIRMQRKQRNMARKRKRQLQLQQQVERRWAQKWSSIIVIRSNHRLKLLWDALTILITLLSAVQLHTYIRDRSTYEYDAFLIFTNVWFGIDLLLNFITDHRSSDGTVIKTGREVWGRYLTTWFAVDALSLLPWERMFIRPIIIMQNRRNIVTKWFFRSKAVVRVTRFLGRRKYFIKYFGKLSKETKKVGVGADRLIRLLIKYIPKYLLFYRNMKGVLLLKTLRQVHYLRKLSKGLLYTYEDDENDDLMIKKKYDQSIDETDSVCSEEDDDYDEFEYNENFVNHHALRLNVSMD